MKAVILAAGAATRLRPLTDRLPKCLLIVGGVALLRRTLDHLAALGVDGAVIVTGYRGAQIDAAIAAWRPRIPVVTVENRAFDRTNNGHSTLLARPYVDGAPFLLMDADILCDREVVAAVATSPHTDCLGVRPSRSLGSEEMKVVLDERGRVARCAKDVDPRHAAGESIGINRFSAAASGGFFAALDERVIGRGLVNEYNDAAVQQMIDDEGYELWPVDVGAWYATEIDTAEDLALARRAFTDPRVSFTGS